MVGGLGSGVWGLRFEEFRLTGFGKSDGGLKVLRWLGGFGVPRTRFDRVGRFEHFPCAAYVCGHPSRKSRRIYTKD